LTLAYQHIATKEVNYPPTPAAAGVAVSAGAKVAGLASGPHFAKLRFKMTEVPLYPKPLLRGGWGQGKYCNKNICLWPSTAKNSVYERVGTRRVILTGALRRCIVVLHQYKAMGCVMAVSVRLDPLVEAKLTQQANLLGVTKSDFIKDALERVLGMKDPAALLRQTRSGSKQGRRDTSSNVSRLMKARLRAKRTD
jgi:predicted DNA-binding protein